MTGYRGRVALNRHEATAPREITSIASGWAYNTVVLTCPARSKHNVDPEIAADGPQLDQQSVGDDGGR